MFKRFFLISSLLALAGLVSGCTHPISLNSDLAQVKAASGGKVDKKVGYVITEDKRKLEVTTPGGGVGENVSYFPYRDLEAGIYKSLSEVYTGVVRLSGPGDVKIQAEKLSYVITPVITTNSSSDSTLIWPPTKFSIEVVCKVTDDKGVDVAQVTAKGEGRATPGEIIGNTSLTARRAAEDALNNLTKVISENPKLR